IGRANIDRCQTFTHSQTGRWMKWQEVTIISSGTKRSTANLQQQFAREEQAMNNQIVSAEDIVEKLDKAEKLEARQRRTLPKIHTISNREMQDLAGGRS